MKDEDRSDLIILNFFFFNLLLFCVGERVFLDEIWSNIVLMLIPVLQLSITIWKDPAKLSLKEKIVKQFFAADMIYLILLFLLLFLSIYNTYHFYTMGLYLISIWYFLQSVGIAFCCWKNGFFSKKIFEE